MGNDTILVKPHALITQVQFGSRIFDRTTTPVQEGTGKLHPASRKQASYSSLELGPDVAGDDKVTSWICVACRLDGLLMVNTAI